MRAFRLLSAGALAAALVGPPAPAAADIFVSPFLGVKFRGSTNQLVVDTDNGVRDTKSSVGVSGVLLADNGLGVEIDLAHQSRFFERRGITDDLTTRSGVTTLGGNLLLALPLRVTRESLRPYGVVGLGWMHATANDQIGLSPFRNDYLGLTLGVGVMGYVTDTVGLRLDLRRLRSVTSSDTAALSGDLARLSFWRATFGVVFR